MNNKIDWAASRQHPFAEVETPDDWPKGVKPISWNGMNLLGVGPSGGLYWDGRQVKTEVHLGWGAKVVGVLIAISTLLTAVGTVSMAVTDLLRYLHGA
jgi:hypothetical protein